MVFNKLDNKYLQLYKKSVEKITNKEVIFDFATGASDSRYFYNDGTTIIPNQATGGEIHADGEWLDIPSLMNFLEIKKDFINELVAQKI